MSHKLAEPQRETPKHERVLFRADLLSKEAKRTQLSQVKSSTSVKDEHVQDWVLRGAGYPVDTVVMPKIVDIHLLISSGGGYQDLGCRGSL